MIKDTVLGCICYYYYEAVGIFVFKMKEHSVVTQKSPRVRWKSWLEMTLDEHICNSHNMHI